MGLWRGPRAAGAVGCGLGATGSRLLTGGPHQGPRQQPALLPQAPPGPHAAPGTLLRGRQRGVGRLPQRGPVSATTPPLPGPLSCPQVPGRNLRLCRDLPPGAVSGSIPAGQVPPGPDWNLDGDAVNPPGPDASDLHGAPRQGGRRPSASIVPHNAQHGPCPTLQAQPCSHRLVQGDVGVRATCPPSHLGTGWP